MGDLAIFDLYLAGLCQNRVREATDTVLYLLSDHFHWLSPVRGSVTEEQGHRTCLFDVLRYQPAALHAV